MIPFIKTNDNQYNCVVDNKIHSFDSTHPDFEKLISYIVTGDEASFLEMIVPAKRIVSWSEGNFTYNDGVLKYGDFEIPEALTSRVRDMIDSECDYKPMLNFIERLLRNPSARALREVYTWLEHKCLSIDKDGYIIGYKGVNWDYTDCHTSRVSNTVGQKPKMLRNLCDDDFGVDCSQGFHVGTKDYATGFGKRVVLVKVDPEHVVSVPVDCNCQKMRCCEYEVIADYNQEELGPVYSHADEGDYEDL